MRFKLYLITIVFAFFTPVSYAQLPNGAMVPDFTFTDINGYTQNLYTYLNQGKYVALDISTTWCLPCWDYHEGHTMDSLYTLHDSAGDKKWKVFFIEGDPSTNLADLYGTGTNTQGNWVQGSNYSIIDPPGNSINSFLSGYNISFFPTLYLICPDKRVIQDTLNSIPRPFVYNWEYAANTLCPTVGIDNINSKNPLTIYPNPARQTINFYFSLENASVVNLQVFDIRGQVIDKISFGKLYPGDQTLRYDVNNFRPGIYFFSLYAANSWSVIKPVCVL